MAWEEESFDKKNGETIISEKEIGFIDPRVARTGQHIISQDPAYTIKKLHDQGYQEVSLDSYHEHRIHLGVPESTLDLLPEKSIPLECNMDFLQAISWNKGCYLGQELTARTKYQGLVRKRLLPGFLKSSGVGLESAKLLWEGKEVGILRSYTPDVALGLVRLEAVTQSQMQKIPFQVLEEGASQIGGMWIPCFPEYLKER